MNFYKHHLGDYDGATAHLTWTEDMAYTRLLRAYYRREKGFADTADACRLIRANSKPERDATAAILAEFFSLESDGWHNKRADEEIAAYQAQASTNQRIARERTVHQSSTKRERSVNEPSTNGSPATSEKREPNQNQNQNHKPEKTKAEARVPRGSRLDSEWLLPKAWGEWAITEQPTWTPEHCRKVAESFRDHWIAQAGSKGVKADWQATWRNWVRREGPIKAAAKADVSWLFSEKATVEKGKELGIEPRIGESMDAYRDRMRMTR